MRVACSLFFDYMYAGFYTEKIDREGGGQAGYPSALGNSHLRGFEGTPPRKFFCFFRLSDNASGIHS